ncbi:MAG: hypothetical protein H7Y11_04535 [Armatimonadetes bacterium]|nr:hypothetical protein [Anaerolineae bacterium]
MLLSFKQARDYVYTHGALWERVLFGHLFEAAPLSHVHQCLACYKNPDGGWAHGIEHDLKTPDSHPLGLEFALWIFRTTGVYHNNLFNDAAEWVDRNRAPDGALLNPASVLDYPHAPWWSDNGGQTKPTSIVGNLMRMDLCTPTVAASTARWVQANLPLAAVRANEWLFMAYHAHDYFLHVEDFPQVEAYRAAALDNIVQLAEAAEEKRYYQWLLLANSPNSALAKAAPPALTKRILDGLAAMQGADGAWHDEHGLAHWSPWVTIVVLSGLRNYGVWDGDKAG